MKKAVVVTTEARGVFFGYVEDETKAPAQITLSQCRNCVYWAQSVRGFLGLAASGPKDGSRVGPAAAETTLYALTSVLACIAGTLCALAQSWLLACLFFVGALCGCQRRQRRQDEVPRG